MQRSTENREQPTNSPAEQVVSKSRYGRLLRPLAKVVFAVSTSVGVFGGEAYALPSSTSSSTPAPIPAPVCDKLFVIPPVQEAPSTPQSVSVPEGGSAGVTQEFEFTIEPGDLFVVKKGKVVDAEDNTEGPPGCNATVYIEYEDPAPGSPDGFLVNRAPYNTAANLALVNNYIDQTYSDQIAIRQSWPPGEKIPITVSS